MCMEYRKTHALSAGCGHIYVCICEGAWGGGERWQLMRPPYGQECHLSLCSLSQRLKFTQLPNNKEWCSSNSETCTWATLGLGQRAGWGPRQTSNKPQGEATAAGLETAPRVQWQGHTQRVYLLVTCSQRRAMPLATPEPLPWSLWASGWGRGPGSPASGRWVSSGRHLSPGPCRDTCTTAEAGEGTRLSPQARSHMARGQGLTFCTPQPTHFTVMLPKVKTEIPLHTWTLTSQRKGGHWVKEPFQEDRTEGIKWNGRVASQPQAPGPIFPPGWSLWGQPYPPTWYILGTIKRAQSAEGNQVLLSEVTLWKGGANP